MAVIRPFKGIRPSKEYAEQLASKPYDVLSSEEARALVKDNPFSFLRVIKPEVNLPKNINVYADEVYQEGRKQLNNLLEQRVLLKDKHPSLYVYSQIMNGKQQIGLVAGSSIDDYSNNSIKKHEYTRPKKENDRIKHMKTIGAHMGPVFLTYKKVDQIDAIINEIIQSQKPVYQFIAEDNVEHILWTIDNDELIMEIVALFKERVPATYIADGHHRAAASYKVGQQIRAEQSSYNPEAPFNFFLSVLFPDEQLNIIDYNRLVKDLNGLSKKELLEKLNQNFEVTEIGEKAFKPGQLHEIGMYLGGTWYKLTAKENTYDPNDPIKVLDVSILSDYVLDPILGIKDQRTDERIDFVGGIRGLKELESRVNSGEMQIAFAMYPVTIQQLINIADSGNVMPPKSTWFEPKLRSGLIINKFD